MVTGAAGQVGSRVTHVLEERSHEVVPLSSRELDITDEAKVHELVAQLHPDVIINCAAKTAVDACETDPDGAFAANAWGVRNLVAAAAENVARVIHLSSDYVFDGAKSDPYLEDDAVAPLSVYGQSKAAGEKELRRDVDLTVRSSWVMSASSGNIASVIRTLFLGGGPLSFVADQVGTPTLADDLAGRIVDLMESSAVGTVHIANAGETSWWGLARSFGVALGCDPDRVIAIDSLQSAKKYPAPRPRYSALGSSLIATWGIEPLRSWEEAVLAIVGEWARN